MDEFDVFTSEPSTAKENNLFEFGNNDETINNQKDESSWIIENNPDTTTSSQLTEGNLTSSTATSLFESNDTFDNATSSQTFNDNILDNATSSQTLNNDIFENHEQFNTLPPTVEDTLSNYSTNTQSEGKPSYSLFSNEISPLHEINKKREGEIAAKDAEEKRKIDELRQQGKNDLERWYNERQRQMEQKRQTMTNEENDLRMESLEKSTKESCDWSKVIRLLEFNEGTQLSKSKRDLTRMKSCMLTAKRANDKKKLENGS